MIQNETKTWHYTLTHSVERIVETFQRICEDTNTENYEDFFGFRDFCRPVLSHLSQLIVLQISS